MTDRLRKIAAQVTASSGTARDIASMGASQEIQNEAFAAAMEIREKVLQSQQELMENGTPLDYTRFDMDLATDFQLNVPPRAEISRMLDEAHAAGRLELCKLLPGPLSEVLGDREKEIDVCLENIRDDAMGWKHYNYLQLQRKYGENLDSNICVPVLVKGWDPKVAKDSPLEIHMNFLIAHHLDSERISRVHIRKSARYGNGAYDSLIATQDNDYWREQRNHLNEAFLPLASLARILPVSLARAKHCAERLERESANGTPVDMSDFFLHETMAQMQLALMGTTNEQMERLNKPVRGAFGGRKDLAKVGQIGEAMKEFIANANENPGLKMPSESPGGILGTDTIRGPLSRAVATSDFTHTANYGNGLIILFAGHDTTGHTMTWLALELARHPEVQKKLQKEVAEFHEMLDGRDPTYQDLYKLSYMDRCITEVMRLWPVVPGGTFRELQFPDFFQGPGGKEVQLPRGAQCNVIHWPRFHNPDLWGDDAWKFNPDREFLPDEIVSVGGPKSAVNPQTHRFSPFAYGPRSCLGKNFAQMEMRLILAQLLHKFDFSLAGKFKDQLEAPEVIPEPKTPDDWRGVGRGTMGPMDLDHPYDERVWGRKYNMGLKMHATVRAQAREPAVVR